MLTNLKWYLVGTVLVLLPVGVRVLTWNSPRGHRASADDIAAGQKLFSHEWTEKDPLCGAGDGLGPVFNARSCAACHQQGGVGGGGDNRHNVTTYVLQQPGGRAKAGVVHLSAIRTNWTETLGHFDAGLPRTSQPTAEFIRQNPRHHLANGDVLHLSQRNTPALFGAKVIDEISDRAIIAEERRQRLRYGLENADSEQLPVGRALRLADGRIGKFGWKAQSATLAEFVEAACANELGLGNPRQSQPAPLASPDYRAPGTDLTLAQCNQITAFCASLSPPIESPSPESVSQAAAGKILFHRVGCVHCHTPNLGPAAGIYSDLLLHRMGQHLVGGGSYNDPIPPPLPDDPSPGGSPRPDEWRTPPLWGVADSAPYLHDGRAATLHDAITAHEGQGAAAARSYATLSRIEREELLAFLRSLRAPRALQMAQK